MSSEWPDLSDVPCAACGAVGTLRIEERFEAKPIGTWSLAGMQAKLTGTMWPWMVCDGCGRESRGKSE